MSSLRIEASGADALLWVKAVPGASRSGIAGVLGERLKVRVSAPAEGGKANAAVCATVAEALGVKARQVSIESGHGSAEKVLRVAGIAAEQVRERVEPRPQGLAT